MPDADAATVSVEMVVQPVPLSWKTTNVTLASGDVVLGRAVLTDPGFDDAETDRAAEIGNDARIWPRP